MIPYTALLTTIKEDFIQESLVLKVNKLLGAFVLTVLGMITYGYHAKSIIHCTDSGVYSSSHLESMCLSRGLYKTEQFTDGNEVRISQDYYELIPIFLFMCAIGYYIPTCSWHLLEGRRIQELIRQINTLLLKEKKRIKIVHLIIMGKRNISFVIFFLVCELACLGNLVIQYFLLNEHMNDFLNIYTKKYIMGLEGQMQPFPLEAKCDLETIGAGGRPQKSTVTCELSVNRKHSIVAHIQWAIMLILFIMTCIHFFLRLHTFTKAGRRWILFSTTNTSNYPLVRSVSDSLTIPQWYMVRILGSCVSEEFDEDMLEALSATLRKGSRLNVKGIELTPSNAHTTSV